MFGIGMPELLLILAVALIVIGPKKLPDLAKSLGRAMGEFKRATNDLKQSIEQDSGLDEVRQSMKAVNQDLRQSIDPIDARPKTDDDGDDDVKREEAAGADLYAEDQTDEAPTGVSSDEDGVEKPDLDMPDASKEGSTR